MFNEQKTTALTRMILSEIGSSCPYMKVIKLLYLMDRKMLELYNEVITGDTYVSMRFGPVLSNTLNLIKTSGLGEYEDLYKDGVWDKYIRTEGYNLELTEESEPAPDATLTQQELDACRMIIKGFASMNQWELVDYTHEYCPEWRDPSPCGVQDLPLSRILLKLDKPEEVLMKFASQSLATMGSFLGG